MARVFVLGSFVVDLMCRTPHLPAPGETVFGGPFKMGAGGKGSNQAVAASRSGADVTLLTKLGQDTFGTYATDFFKNENMNLQHVITTPEHETGAALIMVDDKAENAITVSVGACNHISNAEVMAAKADIEQASVFLTQLETNLTATFKGLELAKAAGVKTILNTAPIQPVKPEQLNGIDFITPNETEAQSLTGMPVTTIEEAKAAAEKLHSWGVGHVLITLGEKGVLVFGDGLCEVVPAFNVTNVTDTTGAGDAFNGGFAAALAEGQPLLEAVRYGCAVAAICVQHVGTAPAMPHREQVEALLTTANAA